MFAKWKSKKNKNKKNKNEVDNYTPSKGKTGDFFELERL